MMQKKRTKNVLKRTFALQLVIVILFQTAFPTFTYALSGGPTQPEFSSFAPVGTSDMVNVFSGDFSYNIPLLDVEGYPVNISYQSGISMDQEASWVGLGWNINAGAINRNMRGMPDDFKGDKVKKTTYMKPNISYGGSIGVGDIEIFGWGKLKDVVPGPGGKISLGVSLGLKYNNYTGLSVEQSVNVGLTATNPGKSTFNAGLGLSSSSDEGLSLTPSVSFSGRVNKSDKKENYLGASIGTSFNARGGLKALSITTSSTMKTLKSGADQKKAIAKQQEKNKDIVSGTGPSSTFDFGSSTYTPSISNGMNSLSISGRFKLGGELFGVSGAVNASGFYSKQEIANNIIESPAFGYLYSQLGQNNDDALHDFNREKDAPFSIQSTSDLPITNYTFDTYSVFGQGIGGSYRAFRNDIGYVYDPATTSTSDGYSAGGEVSLGNAFHAGGDILVNMVEQTSGKWTDKNDVDEVLNFKPKTKGALFEPTYFKEANERSVDDNYLLAYAGGLNAKSFDLKRNGFNYIAKQKLREGGIVLSSANFNEKRVARTQPITHLTVADYKNLHGTDDDFVNGSNGNPIAYPFEAGHGDIDHHIAEMTSLSSDGSRYVYGLPAYNTVNKEVTFATNQTAGTDGLVPYTANDITKDNKNGLDNFVSITETPAYAHSYLLTSVLSSDYIDNDGVVGPSDNDMGAYTKFNYEKAYSDYKWRTPLVAGGGKATHNEGLRSVAYDDKASYIYGQKEVYYLKTIETQNYIAIFSTSARMDGLGVADEAGTVSGAALKKLDSIKLYAKRDYKANPATAIPLKEVYFTYDYSLCPSSPNSNAAGNGKLTLKSVQFAYQNSYKATFSPYTFAYSTTNPNYKAKNYDRWGNYKVDPSTSNDIVNGPLSNAYNPYVEQNKAVADVNVSAWTLNKITLPSGGIIEAVFESDDYAYVQDKKATCMFQVVDAINSANPSPLPAASTLFRIDNQQAPTAPFLPPPSKTAITIKFSDPATTTAQQFRDRYLDDMKYMYFKFLMNVRKQIPINPNNSVIPALDPLTNSGDYEYITGYVDVSGVTASDISLPVGTGTAIINIPNVNINDNSGSSMVSPFTKAAVQFVRLNLSREFYNDASNKFKENASFGKELIEALVSSDMLKNFIQTMQQVVLGVNGYILNHNIGKFAVKEKSFVRLIKGDGKKLGGGLRVKEIKMNDSWANLSLEVNGSYEYGQTYNYNLPDGTSSGVAIYEPQLGGDENPLKQPLFTKTKNLLAPDDEHYIEEPLGESFYPSPSVGYSRVTVTNLTATNGAKANLGTHKTGKTVHQFYTSRDFPVIATRTKLNAKQKSNKKTLGSIFKLNIRDYISTSQGYSVILNDMHGKQKSIEEFAQGNNDPISGTYYKYKTNTIDVISGNEIVPTKHLDNTITTINDLGQVNTNAKIGLFMDAVADLREYASEASSIGLAINTDGFVIPPFFFLTIPMALPNGSYERTKYRSAVFTKVFNAFGVIDEVTQKDLGSTVSVQNLAYDAETGEVLLTKTTNAFNDPVYDFKMPSYWYNKNMGPAYRNIGLENSIAATNGIAAMANAQNFYREGDVLANTTNNKKLWVAKVNANSIEVVDDIGSPANINGDFKIIQSGYKNHLMDKIQTVSLLSNPLNTIASNIYEKVIASSAIEYGQVSRTYCQALVVAGQGKGGNTINPYLMGTLSYWKPLRTWTYLTERTQEETNANSNIRRDGVFKSFNPYYKIDNGVWKKDESNWTFANEVTEFSPQGAELENRDALNVYSGSILGYNQSKVLASGYNSRYKELAFDGFEDYAYNLDKDNHFRLLNQSNYATGRSNATAHTGTYSIKVASGSNISISKQLASCEMPACLLTAAISPTTAFVSPTPAVYTLTPNNAVGNTTVKYQITAGNPSIQLLPGGSVRISLASGDRIQVLFTDINDCKVSIMGEYNNCRIVNRTF
jgi:hypothetical protein